MKCSKCHFNNPDDNLFCNKCGNPLVETAQTSTTLTTKALSEKAALDFVPGQYFGKRYQVIEEIGRGGMGRVYKAIDQELNRIVALKMITPELSSNPVAVERFKKEIKLASQISHENVCRIHDLGEVEGIKYISMQFIDGHNLKELIQTARRLSVESAIQITEQICQALTAAHKKGVIHRDLKPPNIRLDKKGNAYVMDFGIARSLEAKEVTKPGEVIGTPRYMSPEQAEGREVDHRSDIYSLGALMYEMLTGSPPFKADTIAGLIHKHITKAPKPPSKLNPQVPKILEEIILKCLEKTPERRYQRADEIIKAIKEEKLEFISAAKPSKIESNSIAVLPFADMSPQKDQEYFCDGITEELINSLTKIKDLRVVARTSAFSLKGRGLDIRQIGKKLNVQTVLEGSVRKAGNRLRISAQLINISDGYHLWSDQYDCELNDVFAIQDEISLAIVDKLKGKLLKAEQKALVKRYTEDLEAYNLYLKGLYFSHKWTEQGIHKGLENFLQAIEKDPSYILAYAAIADCYTLLGYYDYLPPKEAFPGAKPAAEKALQIDDTLAEANASLAWIRLLYDWDWLAAERAFKRAIELKPGYALAHQGYAGFLGYMGRHQESIAEAKRAQELDPLSLPISTYLGAIFYWAHNYDQAIEQLKKTLEMDPQFFLARFYLAFAYIQKKMYKEATAEAHKAINLSGGHNLPFLVWLGIVYSFSGKKDEAKKVLSKLSELSKDNYVSPFFTALVYVGLGMKDQAFKWLKKAYDERDHWMILLKVEAMLDSLRSDLRFKALLKKMNL